MQVESFVEKCTDICVLISESQDDAKYIGAQIQHMITLLDLEFRDHVQKLLLSSFDLQKSSEDEPEDFNKKISRDSEDEFLSDFSGEDFDDDDFEED